MARKTAKPTFDQALQILRSHSFDVQPYGEVAGGMLVSKHGVGAVLVASAEKSQPVSEQVSTLGAGNASVGFAVHPGVLVRGQIARLLDRGYQKFIRTAQYELPATAAQLQAIHTFSEELKTLIGDVNLYNESLGTTSDVYLYDRLKGRDKLEAPGTRPWELTEGH